MTPAKTAPKLTEAQFQQQYCALAQMLGWRIFRQRYALGADPGWPDVVALRGTRIVAAELKAQRGRVTDAQTDWIAAFNMLDGGEGHLWWPQDIDEITRVLR